MEHPHRAESAGAGDLPGPEATAAGAFAPPPASGRGLLVFVAALLAVVCGAAGVLLFFTELPARYAVLSLAVALAAAVVLGRSLRRGRRGNPR